MQQANCKKPPCSAVLQMPSIGPYQVQQNNQPISTYKNILVFGIAQSAMKVLSCLQLVLMKSFIKQTKVAK